MDRAGWHREEVLRARQDDRLREFRHDDPGSNLSKTFNGSFVHHSDIDFWGVGTVQNIEAAAMDLYALYHHADGDVTNQAGDTLKLDAFDMVIAGARINF